MRRRILEQISSGFGMTAASMTAKPTQFPIASSLEVPAQDQFGTLRCPFMSSAKDGLLRWVDCDTCLLTLKALQFSEWCMPAASTGVSTSSGYVTAGGADPTTLSRIEEYHYIKLR